MKRILAAAFALSLLAGPALARADTVTANRLVDIPVLAPEGAPTSLVVYLSDRAGWKPSDDTLVKAMRDAGSVVLSVDFARYAKALDADDGACLYVVGEITDLAQKAQRLLGISDYLPPIVAGSGEGATFAYAAIADSPANTLGGAVALGFENRLTLREPFCPGAKSAKLPEGGYRYGFDTPLPDDAYLIVDPARIGALETATADADNITLQPLQAGKEAEQLTDAIRAVMDDLTPPTDLPTVDLPPEGPARAVAVFASGDGGWRDIDKSMGEWMSGQGIHVVGLDSLRYFWSKRRPEEFASDLSAIVKQADPTGKLPVMLIGYSFGADAIPFAWPYLDQELKQRIKQISLLALSDTADFQISVTGFLGIADGGMEVAPAVAALPPSRVVCVYGEDDDDGACPSKLLDDVTRIRTTGGHHFDGDYEALGARILKEFSDRMART